jgi:5-methylcytosine-specific restriction protein B
MDINSKLLSDSKLLLDSKKQIILYWPPWTGKTYSLKNIIENHSWEKYNDLENDWRVEFITFHQSFSYEEFIEWIKPDLDWDTEEINYKIEDGIFKKIVNKAKIKWDINIDEKIEELKESLINNSIEIDENSKFTLKYRWWKTFKFSPKNSKNPDTDYPVNIDKIKNLYLNNINRKEIYNSTYAIWILEYLYKNWLKKYDNIEKGNIKNYYLIIDEINRWNISKIFGELITLLEPDKRIWEKNEIITKLPYSKEDFWIPSNLFIVATMNTSDKSIVSLDTALRRRFWFQEILPDYSVEWLNKNIEWINLSSLLQKINNRIEYLIDKDHLIWHSYFLKTNNISDLKLVIYNEILPLLEEYFYWEEEKIRLVLWKSFFEEKEFDDKLFENKGDFENDEKQYKINKNLNDKEFIDALNNIIKSNEEN